MIGELGDGGAVKLTTATRSPATALTFVAAPGGGSGVTALDGFDFGPVPSRFVAVTLNVYEVPSFSPLIVIGLVAPPACALPGEAKTS